MDMIIQSVLSLLYFTLILPNNYVVPTEAESTDKSSESNNDSESDHSGGSHDNPQSVNKYVRWTPKMKYELIDLWEKADPLRSRYKQRLHHMWSQNHEEYSNVSPMLLRMNAERFIREWKGPFDEWYNNILRILNEKRRFPWTPELRSSLLECHAQSGRNGTEFKRLWDMHNPRYNYLTYQFLKKSVENQKALLERGGVSADHVWSKEREQQLMDIWDETFSTGSSLKRAEKIFEEWKRRHPEMYKYKPGYLKTFATSLVRSDTARRIAQGERSEKLQRRMIYFDRLDKRISWTPEMISDLLKCYRMYKRDTESRVKCWQKLQPKYAYMSASHLGKVAVQFLKRSNRHTRKVEGNGEQPEGGISGDHEASSNASLQLHQSTVNQQTPHTLHVDGSQYGYGKSSRGTLPSQHNPAGQQFSYIPYFKDSQYEPGGSFSRTPRLHQLSANQPWPYSPRFGGSQDGYGESSRGTLTSQHASASQQFSPDFGGSQYEYGESSSVNPRLHLFIPTDATSHPYQSGGSYQGHDANLSNISASEPISQDQQSLEHQESKKRIHRKESQKSKSEKGKEVLDLDLHL